MILQSLKEYYDRKGNDLPHVGWIEKGIDYAIVLKVDGAFQQIDCLQETENGKAIPSMNIVPNIGKQALKHTNSHVDANLLWDNSAFVLGVGSKGEKKLNSFVDTIKLWLGDIDDDGVSTVISFLSFAKLSREFLLPILEHPEYGESIRSGNPIITFRLLGDECRFICERPAIRQAVSRKWGSLTQNAGPGICLITGRREDIETCHTVIKGVRRAQTSGATIIGFNEASFRSFSKEQGANAPVGKTAAFAYTTALNHLLAKDSRQRMLIGDATTVFWAEKAVDLETKIVDIFGEPPKDDPDRGINAVKSLYKSVDTGALATDEGQINFYVLGLSPNASRIAIRFWIVDTVSAMASKIVQHFDDLRIIHGPKEKDTLSLFRLLVSTAAQGKSKNIPPNLAGETVRAILNGLPYPQTLLQAVVRRIRAEQSAKDKNGKSLRNVTYARASLIKAIINRDTRFKKPKIKEELKMSLDPNNANIGYRLGRLFAELEKLQIRVHTQNGGKEPNSTIRDRFYGAASGVPASVFGTLIRLSKHHLSKLEYPGERVNFEKRIGAIMDAVEDFPAHLRLEDQGRFAIGYYHQKNTPKNS